VTSYPFLSPAVFDALQLDAADPRARGARGGQPGQRARVAPADHAAAGLLASLARNVSRGQQDVAVYETGRGLPAAAGVRPGTAGPADRRPDDATLAELDAALPGAAAPHRRRDVRPARAGRATGGPGAPAVWADAVQAARDVCDVARRPAPAVTPPPRCRSTRAAARRSRSTASRPATPASCTRAWWRARAAARTCAMELDLTPCSRRRSTSCRAGDLQLPAGHRRRRAAGRRADAGSGGRGGAARRCGRAARGVPAVRRLRRPQVGAGAGRSRSALRFRAGTARSPTTRCSGSVTRRAVGAGRTGAELRGG
jgi:hypothetical protein